jgi:hypothetical protein
MSVLSARLARLEQKAGSTDQVQEILDGVSIWHVDALHLKLIALIAEASGLPVKDGPTEAMLRSSHLGSREKYEAAIAAIPEGIFERLLSAFIARAGEKDLLDEVLDHRALTLRRSKLTQFFPDEDIIEVAAK